MYTKQSKKMLPLNILEILQKYTDENHTLSQKEIEKHLADKYDMVVDRRSVKRGIMDLIDMGFEIHFTEIARTVKDKKTGNIRLLTPVEVERIQGFPDNWTKECLVNGETVEMPVNKRRFMMGNALVVNLVAQMEIELNSIIEAE